MAYRICKVIEVESGHMLSKNDAHCSFPHGHTRKVELVLEAEELDSKQMVCDYRAIKMLMGDYLKRFDHTLCVNTKDPNFGQLQALFGDRIIAFDDLDPTTEVIAKTIFDEAARRLDEYVESADKSYPMQAGIRVASVRVWETSTTWAEYGG